VEFPGQRVPAGQSGHNPTPIVGLKVPGGHPSGSDEPIGHCVEDGQANPPSLLIG
jgi:hypothetical protein